MIGISKIEDCEIEKIKNKEVLLKEYEHTNNLLELYYTFLDRIGIILFTGISITLGYILKMITELATKNSETINQFSILTSSTSYNVLLYIICIAIISIFIVIIFLKLSAHSKIITRKKLIINQLNKLDIKKYKNGFNF